MKAFFFCFFTFKILIQPRATSTCSKKDSKLKMLQPTYPWMVAPSITRDKGIKIERNAYNKKEKAKRKSSSCCQGRTNRWES
ncbi:hypothetical protein BD560DRAFT_53113 [Blakeslea trispora]|nr:hypothetical protein BD560DRAFT_53113 [Blakeslea trispora]